MGKFNKYIIRAEVVVYAKSEKEAKEKFEDQLSFSKIGDHPLEESKVEQYDEKTKIKNIEPI